jgi:hypothetical protein
MEFLHHLNRHARLGPSVYRHGQQRVRKEWMLEKHQSFNCTGTKKKILAAVTPRQPAGTGTASVSRVNANILAALALALGTVGPPARMTLSRVGVADVRLNN